MNAASCTALGTRAGALGLVGVVRAATPPVRINDLGVLHDTSDGHAALR